MAAATTDNGVSQESDDLEKSHPSTNLAAIDLDLERTFSNLSSAAGARSQAKILLNRFVEEHPIVGYTQGMNYVATCLIMRHTREGGDCAEEVAYQQFVSIMARLSGLWSDGLPLLEPAIGCYLKCCKKYLPRLYARLVYLNVDPLAYLPTGWLSLFSKWLPMDCVLLVLDLVADLQLQPMKPDKLISCTTMVWLPRVQKTVGADLERASREAARPFPSQQSKTRDTTSDSQGDGTALVEAPTEQAVRRTASSSSAANPLNGGAPGEGVLMNSSQTNNDAGGRCRSEASLKSSTVDSEDTPTTEIARMKMQLSEKDAIIESLRREIAVLKEEREDAIEMQMRCVQAKDELQRELLGEIAQLRDRLGD
ncbi:hypothetical protein FOL47_010073 [Perkinsus chesapeaki]|uniref:Rab-GAP TBC domain-containing protein n=1 Tax=Perkinsus chesapeaki TaxID=330153 RepID=A0A7J6MQN2_PERCH|nr:hypothetical protein FOL47_010073 [Perkinsus chesapeaki]